MAGTQKSRCVAEKSDKKRCTRQSIEGSIYCKQHHKQFVENDGLIAIDDNTSLSMDELPSMSDLETNISNLPMPDILSPNHSLSVTLEEVSIKNRHLVDEITSKTMENTNLENELRQLRCENVQLSQKIDELTRKLSGTSLSSNHHVKKRRYKAKQIDLETKAKRLLYLEKKNDENILNEIRTKLSQAGLLFQTKIKVYGGIVEKEVIPWQYKKAYTDFMWDNVLTEEQRKLYRDNVSSDLN
jgi:hypothetical protein